MAKAKASDLLPIPGIRVLLKTHSINLEPITHQVSALPIDDELEYYFVPAEHMELFRPYFRPERPYKNFKMINFGRPAISVSFYSKHKYRIDKNVDPKVALEILAEHRETLYNRSFLEPMTAGQINYLKKIDELIRTIRLAPEDHQYCISNYHHYYRYWYCSFRYFEDDERTLTGTTNEHMLKHTQRTDERSMVQLVNERINLIFVDTNYITKPIAYDNKLIDRELETYPSRIVYGKSALYIKDIDTREIKKMTEF